MRNSMMVLAAGTAFGLDGSVLVTCSAADGKIVAVQRPHQG